MTALRAIYEEFNTDYKESWSFLSIYLREMEECLGRLTKAIREDETAAARAALHQMLGGTQILNYTQLEGKLVQLQSIVKSTQPSIEGAYLLDEIQELLDALFEYLMEKRPHYEVYVLTPEEHKLSIVKSIVSSDPQVSMNYGSTIEDYESWCSDHDTELVIVDCGQDSALMDELAMHMSSAFDETPVMLITDSTDMIKPGDLTNVCGQLTTSSKGSQWMEAIKTVINGRAY